MAKYYVNVRDGSDHEGDGSSGKPYKTINHTLNFITHGDEIAVVDLGTGVVGETVFEEEPIRLIGMSQVTINFLSSNNVHSDLVWQATSAGPDSAIIYAENCSDLSIIGGNFLSYQSPDGATGTRHAIKAYNSDIILSHCHINSGWKFNNEESIELFSLDNCNAKLSYLTFDGLHNPYPFAATGEANTEATVAFIALNGNSNYVILSCSGSNYTCNNGRFVGLDVKKETKYVLVDGLLVHNISSDILDNTFGIRLDSDRSPVEFIFNSCQLSNIDIGIELNNVLSSRLSHRIKHSTFYKCRTAVLCNASVGEVYSVSIYGGGYDIQHEYPPGNIADYPVTGIRATDGSNIHVLNTIMTECGYAAVADTSALVRLEHIIWNNCRESFVNNTMGRIIPMQYIRRIDPLYEDLHADEWGYFLVQDVSPCIDSGREYGENYMGGAPDIGALERSRKVRTSDLPAMVAKSMRYSEVIPLTSIDIEGMILKGLDTSDPEIKAGREGSIIRDIAVKPLKGLLAPLLSELENLRNSLSFTNIKTMSSAAADALAANLFVNRRSGEISSGVVRIYFKKETSITVPSEMEFVSSQGLRFFSTQEVSISAEEMSLNFENGLYYVDVVVEGESIGAEYNIPANDISRALGILPSGVVSVTNPYAFVGGLDTESNVELHNRIANAITVRDLVTKKAIRYVLPETFPSIRKVTPIGFGDPEMLRDKIFDVHIGGKVDIYIQTESPTEDFIIVENLGKETFFNKAIFSSLPIININSIDVLDPLTNDDLGMDLPKNRWWLKDLDEKSRFSINESTKLVVEDEYVGLTVRINYSWIPEIKAIQDWVNNSEQRVVCADLMVKHYRPRFISTHVSYYGPTEVDGLDLLLGMFISSIPSGSTLQTSDLINYMYSLGVTHVVSPLLMVAETTHTDGVIHTEESNDELSVENTGCFLPLNIGSTYMGRDD